MVIGEDVAGQLAPYDENTEVDPYVDVTGPGEFWFASDVRRALYLPEDAVLTARQVVSVFNAKYAPGYENATQADVDPHYVSEDGTRPVFATAEGGVGEWRTYNPASKWDYWRVGGRWGGFLKLNEAGIAAYQDRDEDAPEITPRRWDSPEDTRGSGVWADAALKKHVDWEGMRTAAATKAENEFRHYATLVKDAVARHGMPPRWAELLDKVGEDNVNEARRQYRSHRVNEILAHHRLFFMGDVQDVYGPDLSDGSRAAYVERQVRDAFVTYAVVRNGQWHAQAEMGWFGVSHDEHHGKDDWASIVNKLVDILDGEVRVTIVDCHI
jgi:hypothetical protein